MVYGAIAGLFLAAAYTLLTGRLQLTKERVVYGTAARVLAVLSLLPVTGLAVFARVSGQTTQTGRGMALFLLAMAASIGILYGGGWRLAAPPRR